jgi:two-component system, response regulator YesN
MFKILLVEDNVQFRGTIEDELNEAFDSIDIEEARDGREAMDKVESFHPQLILMDIRLPGESGLELTRIIKGQYPEIKVIIMSSYDYPEYREAAKQYGAVDYFVKGETQREEVREAVKSIMDKAA